MTFKPIGPIAAQVLESVKRRHEAVEKLKKEATERDGYTLDHSSDCTAPAAVEAIGASNARRKRL